MPRPVGVKETKPRAPGAGRKPGKSWSEVYRDDPEGSSVLRLPNSTLAYLEKIAAKEGKTVTQYLNGMEINSRII